MGTDGRVSGGRNVGLMKEKTTVCQLESKAVILQNAGNRDGCVEAFYAAKLRTKP